MTTPSRPQSQSITDEINVANLPGNRAGRAVRRANVIPRPLSVVLVASAAVGAAFVAIMPPGLPYDEPSHWANVVFYLNHLRMPRLGEFGVSYEAQMGPVAYVADALVAAPLCSAGNEVAFYGVRVFGLVLHLLLVVLIWRLTRRALPAHPGAATMATIALGLNPMLLAMSTSVQNDTLSLVLAVAAVDAATARAVTARRSALIGVLAGAALLTKITVWPVVLVVGLWLLIRRRWVSTFLYGAAVVAVSGWWFLRNQILYGDLTARAGVAAAGYDFPAPEKIQPISLIRSAIAYLWLPTEYVRNLVESPLTVDILVLLLSFTGVAGALMLIRHARHIRIVQMLAAVAAFAVTGWLVVATTMQGVAFRVAYAALPIWFLAVGGVAVLHRHRAVPLVLAAVLTSVAVWFLASVMSLPSQPFELDFN